MNKKEGADELRMRKQRIAYINEFGCLLFLFIGIVLFLFIGIACLIPGIAFVGIPEALVSFRVVSCILSIIGISLLVNIGLSKKW